MSSQEIQSFEVDENFFSELNEYEVESSDIETDGYYSTDSSYEEEDSQYQIFKLFDYYDEIRSECEKLQSTISQISKKLEKKREKTLIQTFKSANESNVPVDVLFERIDVMSDCMRQTKNSLKKLQKELDVRFQENICLFYPKTQDKFSKNSYEKIVTSEIHIEGPKKICAICGDETDCFVSIQRKCLSCSGPKCECKQLMMCNDCSISWYWNKSKKFTKTHSCCPSCRAQYCLKDITKIKFSTK